MELQWPLILFTTFLAWSAGLFATQCVCSTRGLGGKAQQPSVIVSFALLVIGGISVFFHLGHWERIFNGFGHITSGITQELIAIVVLLVVMIAYFSFLRRGEGNVPTWLAVVGVVVAVLLVVIMGHSYMMASRPAWNSVLQPLSLLGAAAAMGTATFAAIDALTAGGSGGDDADVVSFVGLSVVAGSALNVVAVIAYVAAALMAVDTISQMGYYFDPNFPLSGIDTPATFSPFAEGAVVMTVVAIIAAAVGLVLAVVGRKSANWKLFGCAIVLCAFVSAIALRMMMYAAGGSVFMFY